MAFQHSGAMRVQAHRLDAIAATRHGHVSIVNLTMSGGRLTVARTITDSWPRNPDRPAPVSSRKTPRRTAAWIGRDYRGNSNRRPANGRSREAVDRETAYLFPPSVQDWLPETHLARFVVEVVEGLSLRDLIDSYAGRGTAACPPQMLMSLLFYGYATGVFSSRKLERATYDSVAFRYIAANTHPDHDTISAFRQRFSERLKPVFVEILTLAWEMGLVKVGRVSVDGTKVLANASKHSALSWEHACRLEQQLEREVTDLLRLAEQADAETVPDGMDIPAELARRETRLTAIAAAKATLEARAAERYAAEPEEYQRKRAAREEQARTSGKKPGGREPKPPAPGGPGQAAGQSDGRGIADHAGVGWRIRAGLQRADRGGRGQSLDRGRVCQSSVQR